MRWSFSEGLFRVNTLAATVLVDDFEFSQTADDFLLGTDVALPVELLSFDAKAEGDYNRVDWAPASEKNVGSFEVERSGNGRDGWVSMGSVVAAGAGHVYSLTDLTPLGLSYYRLKMVDVDGAVAYSKVVAVQRSGTRALGGAQVLQVFPQPSTQQVWVDYFVERSGAVVYQVFDWAGRLHASGSWLAEAGMNRAGLNVEEWVSGMYYFCIEVGGVRSEVKKVVVEH